MFTWEAKHGKTLKIYIRPPMHLAKWICPSPPANDRAMSNHTGDHDNNNYFRYISDTILTFHPHIWEHPILTRPHTVNLVCYPSCLFWYDEKWLNFILQICTSKLHDHKHIHSFAPLRPGLLGTVQYTWVMPCISYVDACTYQ